MLLQFVKLFENPNLLILNKKKLHFVWFFNTDGMYVVQIHPQVKKEPAYLSLLIMMMTWRHEEPGHQ